MGLVLAVQKDFLKSRLSLLHPVRTEAFELFVSMLQCKCPSEFMGMWDKV